MEGHEYPGPALDADRPPEVVFEQRPISSPEHEAAIDPDALIRQFEAHLDREARRHGYL